MLSLDLRPKRFSDFVGQKITISEFQERAKSNNWPSVMFFVGASGTGKTSLAFVISALMTGSSSTTPEGEIYPNLDDPIVQDIFNQKFYRDVMFYDASNMSKDDVLALQKEVQSPSMFGARKILIIDEAQELSKAGKGATLTLLENMKSGVHIILCTMNPDRFDKAILSRGQPYKFRSPSIDELAEHLYNVSEKVLGDKIDDLPDTFFTDILIAIAESVEGNIRLAIQYLERVLNGKIYTKNALIEELGVVSSANLVSAVFSLVRSESKAIDKISAIGAKEFFYKSWTILLDAEKHSLGIKLSANWKLGTAAKFQKNIKEVNELLQIYTEIDAKGFFIERVFITQLVMWIQRQKEIPILEKKEGNAPSRVVGRKMVRG